MWAAPAEGGAHEASGNCLPPRLRLLQPLGEPQGQVGKVAHPFCSTVLQASVSPLVLRDHPGFSAM